MFLLLLVIGLTGLVVMALPAFAGHGPAHPQSALHPATGGSSPLAHAPPLHPSAVHPAPPGGAQDASAVGGAVSSPLALPGHGLVPAETAHRLRFVPSPRAVFSALALYGGFGNALENAAHLSPAVAACAAVVPTLVIERWLVRPVWNLLFRLHGDPSSPLEELILSEARAVVPFRNGRGMIATVRDGRLIQLSAELSTDVPVGLQVKVGDRVRIEHVDARRERVVVSPVRE